MKRGSASLIGLSAHTLLLVSLIALGGAGTAVADHANVTEQANLTVTVDNDTQMVWVEVENTTHNGTTHNANATFYGIDSDGNETEVDTATLSAAENDTDYYETTADGEAYAEYRVVVDGEAAESVSAGVVQKTEGGASGGGLLTGSSFGVPNWMIGVVLLVVVVLYADKQDDGGR